MYIPNAHRLQGVDAMRALIDAYPLGAWVCHRDGALIANHIPFLLDREAGPHGTLLGHVARGNDVWRALEPGVPSVVMFRGPQSYITPNWYPSRAAHGAVVPTWDYVAVHAHGVARVVDDPRRLRALLRRLTEANERVQAAPWSVDEAPTAYLDALLQAIVGVEIPIQRFEARAKLSQDEAMADRLGTVRGLCAGEGGEAAALGQWIQRAIDAEQGPA